MIAHGRAHGTLVILTGVIDSGALVVVPGVGVSD